jgi:hypothetical protein
MSATLPPLLALAQGRRVRARHEAAGRPKELVLHMAVADLLRRLARPDWRWTHFPAGEHRDIRVAAKLKAMGVQRGWPDFILLDPSARLHALELKRRGEVLTDDQEAFRTWCADGGISHAVAFTLEDATQTLGRWGALRLNVRGPS